MFKKIFKIPVNIKKILTNYKILSFDFGQWSSIKTDMCLDADGNPIPWYTYPAIEYLKQFDLRNKYVFEYGSGNSSIFWANNAKNVISIEDDRKWFETISRNKLTNQVIVFAEDKDEYIGYIAKSDRKYDVIIIDGKYRFECARNAVSFLNDGGMIILDNSDWFPTTAGFLRNHNLIEIDFSGFGPINGYTWTTSLFLSRDFAFKPLSGLQPLYSLGSLKQYCDVEKDN